MLRALAAHATSDEEFLSALRRDLEGTLSRHGYELTRDEMSLLRDLRRRTASLGDADLARIVSGRLSGTGRVTTARPSAPASPGNMRTRPGTPSRPGR